MHGLGGLPSELYLCESLGAAFLRSHKVCTTGSLSLPPLTALVDFCRLLSANQSSVHERSLQFFGP